MRGLTAIVIHLPGKRPARTSLGRGRADPPTFGEGIRRRIMVAANGRKKNNIFIASFQTQKCTPSRSCVLCSRWIPLCLNPRKTGLHAGCKIRSRCPSRRRDQTRGLWQSTCAFMCVFVGVFFKSPPCVVGALLLLFSSAARRASEIRLSHAHNVITHKRIHVQYARK